MELTNLIIKFLENFKYVNKENFANNDTIKLISKEIPSNLYHKLENKNLLKIEGSGGKGQPAEIPWICIFSKKIRDDNDKVISAQKGIYIGILIKADFTGMYLSINQGFTYFKNKYGTKEAKNKIRLASEIIRKNFYLDIKTELKDINLNCKNYLGKGYEYGNILAKYYDIKDIINDEIIIYNINEYLLLYDRLIRAIGLRGIESFYDELFLKIDGYTLKDENQKDIDKYLTKNIKLIKNELDCKKKIKNIINNKGVKVYPRDIKVAANALILANYKCEIENTHTTFIRKSNNMNYTEAHHLIPISKQEEFDYSLDIEANIVSLCSNCHNCLHYGLDKEKAILLKKLFENRIDRLNKVGLNITFDELKGYYNIEI
ncbi:MrcB family domain-containing protein [[Clostridium] colinum]|uniref:MrcB family domain-containing protein n=1 Tax=[Clostridium] colinum TaxID=36835 RepID=UPI0020251EC7|nr:DUF3578 domain-containing protein [[Clostridium] colinum]